MRVREGCSARVETREASHLVAALQQKASHRRQHFKLILIDATDALNAVQGHTACTPRSVSYSMTNHDEPISSLAVWGAAPDGVLEDLDLKYKRWSVGWSIVNQRDTQSLPSNDLCQERVRSATRCHTQARDNGTARGKGEGKPYDLRLCFHSCPDMCGGTGLVTTAGHKVSTRTGSQRLCTIVLAEMGVGGTHHQHY